MTSSRPQGFILFAALFIASLITSTLLGSKLVEIFGITVSAGLFIFPFTFVANEIVTEVYGRVASRYLVKCGIAAQLYVLLFVWIGELLPASPVRDLGNAYHQMFALAPRMVLASITAYFVSQFLDIEAFLKIKKITHGKHLWLRANLASYLSQAIDTILFTSIFLGGVIPFEALISTTLTAYLVKIAVGTLDTPFVYLGVKYARSLESSSETRILQVRAIKTSVYEASEDLNEFLIRHIPSNLVQEGSLIAITSKIISIAEKAVVAKTAKEGTPEGRAEKLALIKKEADRYLMETVHQVSLTVKHGILIPSAGIDESNSKEENFILFPKDPYASAERIGRALRAHYGIKNLGIIITDSHTTPLRNGVTGIGLSHFGFKAVRNLVGQEDLFGRVMKMTQVNVLDALSVAAVYEMGETNDACPIAILRASHLEFTDHSTIKEIHIPLDQDLYGAFFEKNL